MTRRSARLGAFLALLAACSSESVTPGGTSGAGGSASNSGGTGNAGSGALAGRGGASGGGPVASGGTGGAQAGTNPGGQSGSSGTGSAGGGTSAGSGAESGGSAGSAGSVAGAGGSGGSGAGTDAIQALRDYLAIERAERPPLAEQPFASVPLGRTEAETARDLLWEDHAELVREERQAESDDKAITIDDMTLRYDFSVFGTKPATGRSLYISLHGGGNAEPSVNDQQWENQKTLYEPDEGIYLAPRAPTDTWNLWHEAHIDGLFARLIENLIVLEEVDPNRVYVMGYSAGGDGVYQLGPRMADSWAAAAMMAGHPNDAKPDSLRNIGFTIHVGALDTAYDRNLIAEEWGTLLDDLQALDPEGYEHEVQVHANKPHWMDLEDAVAVPWMAAFTRNPLPRRIVWLEDDVPHERFYWLALPPAEATTGKRVVATCAEQTITLEAEDVSTLYVRLSDGLIDLDQAVTVTDGTTPLFTGTVPRTIGTLAATLAERGDPEYAFPAEIEVEL